MKTIGKLTAILTVAAAGWIFPAPTLLGQPESERRSQPSSEREANPPVPQRHYQQQMGLVQAPDQIQLQLEQAMINAGISGDQAREIAEKATPDLARPNQDPEELQSRIEEILTEAGIDAEKAREDSEKLAERFTYLLNPELERKFLEPPASREGNEREDRRQSPD